MDQPRGHRREALVAMCPTPWLKGHISVWVAVARPHLRRWSSATHATRGCPLGPWQPGTRATARVAARTPFRSPS